MKFRTWFLALALPSATLSPALEAQGTANPSVSPVSTQETLAALTGTWLQVNSTEYLEFTPDARAVDSAGALSGTVVATPGGYTIHAARASVTLAVRGDRLYVDTKYPGPDFLREVEYRRINAAQAATLAELRRNGKVATNRTPGPAEIERFVGRNLTMLAAAARQRMLAEKVDRVRFQDIVGPGKLIPQVPSIDGESYATLEFTAGAEVQVRTASGVVSSLRFDPNPVMK